MFFNDPILLEIWRVLSGSIFLDLTDPKILSELQLFLAGAKNFVPDSKKPGYRIWLNYLDQFFFNENAPFSPRFFKYYDSIIFNGNYNTTTNSLERINRALKDMAAGGNMPFSRLCRTLQKFKSKYKTLQREEILGNLLENFHNKPEFEQLEDFIETTKEIGSISKMIEKTNALVQFD